MSALTLVYRAAYLAARTLPRPLAMRIALHGSDAAWRVQPHARGVVARNLSLITAGPVSPEDPRVRSVFRHFGRSLIETFTMDRAPQPRVTLEGAEHLRAAKESGRGMIALTAHLGNWELGAVAISRFGVPMAAIALPHADPALDRIFTRLRSRCGIRTIPLGPRAAQQCLAYLREGCWLGMLGDLEVTGEALLSRLGEARVAVPRGPALLSLRARVPVLPMALVRAGEGAFRLMIDAPIAPASTAATESAIQAMADRCTGALAGLIRRAPEQWQVFRELGAADDRFAPQPGRGRAAAHRA